MRELLGSQAAQWDEAGLCWWWWRERASGELVGMTGLNRSRVEGEPVVEVGWSLPVANQGRGLATEMAIASLAWGFGERGLERIVAFAMSENSASEAVMRRAGMTYERDFTRKGFDHVLYVAERGSWQPPATG